MPESVNAVDHIKVFDSNDLVEVRIAEISYHPLRLRKLRMAVNPDDYNLYFEMVAQTFNMPGPLN